MTVFPAEKDASNSAAGSEMVQNRAGATVSPARRRTSRSAARRSSFDRRCPMCVPPRAGRARRFTLPLELLRRSNASCEASASSRQSGSGIAVAFRCRTGFGGVL